MPDFSPCIPLSAPREIRRRSWMRLTVHLRLGLAILMASLVLGCSSAPASDITPRPNPASTPDADTKVYSKFQAAQRVETGTTTYPRSSTTLSFTPAPTEASAPSPPATPATSTPATAPENIPRTDVLLQAGPNATNADMPSSALVHGAASEATGEAAAPVNGRADSFDPGPEGGGGDDSQALLIPGKVELKYPKLGSHLDQLVAGVEAGRDTAEEAAAETPVHRGGSVAVTIHLFGNADGVVAFLKDKGGDPRNVGEDYVEAYVPVALLGLVSEQPGVLRVRAIVPPQADRTSPSAAPVSPAPAGHAGPQYACVGELPPLFS